jgi:hypothetical protein
MFHTHVSLSLNCVIELIAKAPLLSQLLSLLGVSSCLAQCMWVCTYSDMQQEKKYWKLCFPFVWSKTMYLKPISQSWDSKVWSWVPQDSEPRQRELWWSPAATIDYRTTHSSKRCTYWKNCKRQDNFQISEREIGCRSQMEAWHQAGLADWLSVIR